VVAVNVHSKKRKIMRTVKGAKIKLFPPLFFPRDIYSCLDEVIKSAQTIAELKGDIITLPNFSYINQESPKQNYSSPSPFSLPRSSQSRHWRSFSSSRATSTLDIARDSCHKDSATLCQDDKSRGTRWAPLFAPRKQFHLPPFISEVTWPLWQLFAVIQGVTRPHVPLDR